MGLSIKGYVLEPPRVGAANNAFTVTPNDGILSVTDQAAFDAAYPSGSEPNPRVDYFVLVITDGLLVDALFGWTKNEVVQRFDYTNQDQRFGTLGGAPPVVVGTLQTDANTNRLKVYAPLENLPAAPFRVSIGSFPGQTFTATAVTSFGSPATGCVEVMYNNLVTPDDNGKLNWNAGDITTGSLYLGQTVRFQRQQFYAAKESSGNIGILSIDGVNQEDLMLNPLPGTGQFPLLRIGFGLWLTPVEMAVFTPGGPAAGYVEWAPATGELRFSVADIAASQGKPIYYDGVTFSFKQQLPRQTIGVMPAGFTSLPITDLPPVDGDIIFRLPTESVQFPLTTRIAATTGFDATGKTGEVVVKPAIAPDGEAMFSAADRALYSGKSVEVVFGDLPIERGISLRLFRCSANLSGSDPTIKDVTSLYTVGDATLASPIIGAPQVFLPAVPIDGSMTVKVEQGTGSFTTADLARLDVLPAPLSPPTYGLTDGYGYTIDFEKRQIAYAQRKNTQVFNLLARAGAYQLPDVLLSGSGLSLELNEGAGYQPLDLGEDALADLQAGMISFTRTYGSELVSGSTGVASGTTFSDTGASFSTVAAGDVLVVLAGAAKGVYTVATVPTGTSLTTDIALSSATNVQYEIHCGYTRTIGPQTKYGKEVLADRFWVETLPVDPDTKVERILLLGSAQNLPALTLPIPFRNRVNVVFGPSVTITTVPDDTKFSPLPLADDVVEISLATGNLNLSRADVVAPRFRFGTGTFTSAVRMVSDFLGPGPAQGEVHIKLSTGELLFNTADISTPVYWVRLLRRKIDFRLTPELGFFDFTDRFLQREEALITYRPLTDQGPGDLVSERATFIVRKEVSGDHLLPTNQVTFNPNGHQVASNPTQSVFRGGRPQDSTQVSVNLASNTVVFLPDIGFMTDALPHGSTLDPDERVYIDYYIYDAVGGEKTTTVLQTPMATARVVIQEESDNFVVAGDQTTTYPAGFLLRVEQDEVYIIGSATYDGVANETTVTLGYGQKFANSYTDPKLYLPSGITRLSGFLFSRSYFTTELATFETVPRGMPKIILSGDVSAAYKTGTVLLMKDAGPTFIDSYQVTGTKFDDKTGRTEVTLTINAKRQYTSGTHTLQRSVRPILEQEASVAQTNLTPILTQPYTVYRRIEGQPGRVLVTPTDYGIDDSGRVQLTSALLPTEEVTILYTGHRMVEAGAQVRASYTSAIVPTATNGFLDQILKADYTLFSPDTFYFRVEKLSNFQGEVAQQLQKDAQGSTPSGGPTTSNSSQPKLWEQGRESNFFPEGHLANTDIVMRAMLKYYNDAINHLEDLLQSMDGRVVGDYDGRFKFDGLLNLTPRATWAAVTNQIDDIVKVSDYPIGLGFNPTPPPTFTPQFIGTYQKVYLPGRWSRFFPTFRASLSGYTTVPSDPGNGAEVADLGWTNLIGTDPTLFWRLPRAVLLRDAKAGDTVLYVDNCTGATDPVVRPPFKAGANPMKLIAADTTTAYIDGVLVLPVTVTGTVAGPPQELHVTALPVDVPAGATFYLCTTGANQDQKNQKNYRIGTDVKIDLGAGKVTYVKAYFPFDGILSPFPIPTEMCVQEIGTDECVQVNNVVCNNALLAPFRFPALDGKTISDCGDQAVPMINPSQEQELFKLAHTADAITTIVADTTPTTLLTGTLDGALTTIAASAPFVAPVPQPYDLVRFIDGPNATDGYRRILTVDLILNKVTVDAAFSTVDGTARQFLVTASANVATGTFTMFDAYTMQLPGPIPPAIHVGHTVIITNGNRIGARRQVWSLDTGLNRITLGDPIIIPTTSTTFRVSNHLSTYSNMGALTGLSPDLVDIIRDNDHNITPTVVDSEVKAIDRLLDGDPVALTDGVFTDLLPGGSSTGTCTDSTTLEDLVVDFTTISPAITAVHFVFVRNAPNQGIYPVASVVDAHHLTINGTFPSFPETISYRVVSLFGLSKPAVQDIVCVLRKAEEFLINLADFDAILTTTIPVTVTPGVVDPLIYATGVLSTDLTNWGVLTTDRSTFVSGTATTLITGVLATKDKLYDQRFVWIDGRINRKAGITAKQIASIADRLTKTVEQQNSLQKLVTIQKLQAPQPPAPAEVSYTPTCT